MKTTFLIVMLIAATGFVAAIGADQQALPGFSLEDQNGARKTIESIRGDFSGPVIISFWASWCTPCKQEMPMLQELLDRKGHDKLRIVAISIDKPEKINQAKMYVRSKKFDFTFLFDPNGLYGRKKLHIPAIPHLLLLDGDNNIVYRHTGFKPGSEKELSGEIDGLLSGRQNEEVSTEENPAR